MPSSSAPILVLGAGGQVGRALAALLGDACIALDRSGADLSNPQRLAEHLDRHDVSACINAAAYTAVDRAEDESSLAMRINGESPGVIARWCASRGIPMVHYSTDYVFDGSGTRPWSESDMVGPLNAYGASKLAGERAVEAAGGSWLVLRTSWVYDAVGRNFLTTMLRLARERESLRVVADQHGSPTYAHDLAVGSLQALRQASGRATFPSGVYHLCNGGDTTWCGFARAIFDEAHSRGMSLAVQNVTPIGSDEYPVPARRPQNSRLDTRRIRETLGVELREWREALSDCMDHYESN